MKKIIILLIICLPSLLLSQQKKIQNYTISGKILDSETKLPIEDATILFKAIDSKIIKCGVITNNRGNFSLEVEEGDYLVTVEYMSYKTKKLNLSSIHSNTNIGTILLEIDTENLDEIEIISEKKSIEIKSNKMVFNVGKDLASATGTATDLLNNIPLISVDPDGAIKFRGQGNTTVMINGKISSMTKTEALSSIPASSIEKIEVIANPGAKYKASSFSIVNIILKKDVGLNGAISTTVGYKDYYGGTLALNNKTKAVNFFTTISYLHKNPIKLVDYKNEYFTNNVTTSFLNENIETNSKDNAINAKIGASFNLSEVTLLTTTVNYSNLQYNSNSTINSQFLNSNSVEYDTNKRTYLRDLDNEIFEVSVDLEHSFKKEGQQLTGSFTYTNDDELYSNKSTNTNSNFLNQFYTENNVIDNKITDVQFVNPVSDNSTLTLGYNGEFGELPFKYTGTSVYKNIDYSENVHAFFADFENQGAKFYYGVGLRGEFSKINVVNSTNNTEYKHKYDNLFSSVYLEYMVTDTKTISLSYSKKIQRPGYYQLLPYEIKFSEVNSFVGNAHIKPYFADQFGLSYVYSGNKLTAASTLFYNIYKDWMQHVTYESGDVINGVSKLISTIDNVGTVDYYGANITLNYKPNNIFYFSANATLLNIDQTGIFERINNANQTISLNYNQSTFTTYTSLFVQAKIPNLFDIQSNIKHDFKSEGNFYSRKPVTYANLAINKDLFEGNASVSFMVDDLFLSNELNKDIFDKNYFSNSISKNKNRKILVSFTYRFNQSKRDRKVDFDKKEIKPTSQF